MYFKSCLWDKYLKQCKWNWDNYLDSFFFNFFFNDYSIFFELALFSKMSI